MNSISFNGNIKITNIYNGSHWEHKYTTSKAQDKIIHRVGRELFGDYIGLGIGTQQTVIKSKGEIFKGLIQGITGAKLSHMPENSMQFVTNSPTRILFQDRRGLLCGDGYKIDVHMDIENIV